MNRDWTRTQPKILLPFFGATAIEDVLKDTMIVARQGEEATSEERIVLDDSDMLVLDPEMHLALDGAVLGSVLGNRIVDYDLILTVRTPQFLRRELAGRWRCDEDLPTKIDVPYDTLSDARTSGLVEICLAICLRNDVMAEAGWPAFAGSHLARKTFEIGIDRRMATFAFEVLTPELRNERHLPEGTAFVAELESLVEPVGEDSPLGTVYVTPALLHALRSGNAKNSTQIMVAQILDILLDAVADIEADVVVEEGSGLQRVLDWASDGTEPMTWKELRKIVEKPERRRALVQHRTQMESVLRAMK